MNSCGLSGEITLADMPGDTALHEMYKEGMTPTEARAQCIRISQIKSEQRVKELNEANFDVNMDWFRCD